MRDSLRVLGVLLAGCMAVVWTSCSTEEPNNAPELIVQADTSFTAGETMTFTVTATDPDGDAITLTGITTAPGSSFDDSTGVYTWETSVTDSGTDMLVLIADDGENSVTDTINITCLSYGSQVPAITAQADTTFTASQTMTFTVAVSDPNDDALTITASSRAAGAEFDTASRTYTWTTAATDSAGQDTLVITASDAKLSATDTVIVTCLSFNSQVPVIRPRNDTTFEAGHTMRLTLRATDPNGDSLTWTATTSAPGSSFDTAACLYTWATAKTDSGSADTLVVTASDGQVQATDTIIITNTTRVNQAPVFTQADTIFSPGQTMSFKIKPTDANQDSLTLTATNVVPGASFDTATGVYTWATTASDSGIDTLVVTVSDSELTSTDTIIIMCTGDMGLLLLTPNGMEEFSVGTAITISWTCDFTKVKTGVRFAISPNADGGAPWVHFYADSTNELVQEGSPYYTGTTGTITWVVPATITNQYGTVMTLQGSRACKIRVVAGSSRVQKDDSDYSFSVL